MEASSSITSPQRGSVEHARMGKDMPNTCGAHILVVAAMQVLSTSKACSGAATRRGRPTEENCRASTMPVAPQEPPTEYNDQQQTGNTMEVPTKVIALREGDALPEGYIYGVHADAQFVSIDAKGVKKRPDAVYLCTPPKATPHGSDGAAEVAKNTKVARRNTTRNTNKHANAKFAQEMKDSLAGGRPSKITITKNETHLKA